MLNALHLFVPENDLALASGLARYTPVPVGWHMHLSGEALPMWYADRGDRVMSFGMLALTSDGRIWLALCVVSAATHTDAGHIEMHRADSSEYYVYNVVSRKWHKREMPMLTGGEKSVLSLSIQGYTMAEIAEKICLSPDTIKKYRQRIFDKLDVRNISEAIVAATNNKLI